MPSWRPTRQPKMAAASPTIAVRTPMTVSAEKKHSQPPQMCGGGTNANMTFQGKARKCMKKSMGRAFASPPFTFMASWNWSAQLFLTTLIASRSALTRLAMRLAMFFRSSSLIMVTTVLHTRPSLTPPRGSYNSSEKLSSFSGVLSVVVFENLIHSSLNLFSLQRNIIPSRIVIGIVFVISPCLNSKTPLESRGNEKLFSSVKSLE